MSLICTPNLKELLSKSSLTLDTCTLINSLKMPELQDFLVDIKNDGCSLFSVLPVKAEFIRSAATIKEHKFLQQYLESMQVGFVSKIDEELYTEKGQKFMIALRRSSVSHPSYVDTLLLFATYFYSKNSEDTFLITSNHKDVPLEFFDRKGIIVCDNGKNITSEGVYHFNQNKFEQITKKC